MSVTISLKVAKLSRALDELKFKSILETSFTSRNFTRWPKSDKFSSNLSYNTIKTSGKANRLLHLTIRKRARIVESTGKTGMNKGSSEQRKRS
jgi:hypothetical protein